MAARDPAEAPALRAALDLYRTTLNDTPVRTCLMQHSHLPGPRGNLELASAFAEEVAGRADAEPPPWWDLCRGLAGLSARRAPTNDPAEFVAFCGTLGLGAVAAVASERADDALTLLRDSARDPRWRVREAVAMALQRLLLTQRRRTLAMLRLWVEDGDALEIRAAIAALAEPAVLANPELARAAVELHRMALAAFLGLERPTSTGARTLRQALGYSLSVVVVARPAEGLALLDELIELRDADGLWIVRENLRKARLKRRFPEAVARLQDRLAASRNG